MELILRSLLAFLASFHLEFGLAYTFSASEGPPSNPNPNAACLGRDLRDDSDFAVAHRSLPCRSKIRIFNLDNGRHVTAIVADRGPYGKTRNGKYRAVLDMAPLVNRALKAKGQANVMILFVKSDNKQESAK